MRYLLLCLFFSGCGVLGQKKPTEVVTHLPPSPTVTGEYLTPMSTETLPDKIKEFAPGVRIDSTSVWGWKVVDVEFIKQDAGQTKIWVQVMDEHEKPVCKYVVIGNPTSGQDFYRCGEIAEYTMGKLASSGCGHHYAWIKDKKDQFGPQGHSDMIACLGSWPVKNVNNRAGMLVKFKYFPAP